MRYTLLRNATALLEYGGRRILVDPALDPAGHRPPVANTLNQRPNPLVELPEDWREVVSTADAYLVTHLHSDHFDTTAQEVLVKEVPVFSQPEDAVSLGARGFSDVRSVETDLLWEGIRLTRTPASHGTGEIGRLMAPVSGFVLHASNEPTVYVAGDTIWYEEVAGVIATYQPDVIIVNASGASFLEGGKIVMDAEDVCSVHRAAPGADIVIVHLEAINHCHETRAFYRERLPQLNVDLTRIHIPEDGELIEFRRS